MTRYAFEYSTSSQHAASDTRSKFQAIFQFPWGEDEEVDAAHRALLNLQSGVEDPAETPSPGFEQLKLDLMKAIQPYDLSSIMDGMRLMKAHSYNFVSTTNPRTHIVRRSILHEAILISPVDRLTSCWTQQSIEPASRRANTGTITISTATIAHTRNYRSIYPSGNQFTTGSSV